MDVLIFDVVGKLAHFRKFYSNSTALSFTLPPRTTIIGMLASILGIEKEEYYEEFSSDKIRISASLISSVKKTFYKLNYLKVENYSDFRGAKGHTQIPFEVIMPINIQKEMLKYRIFVSCFENGKEIFQQLTEKITSKRSHFSLTLGSAFLTASIKNAFLISGENVIEKCSKNEVVEFSSAVISDNVEEIKIDTTTVKDFIIEEEQMPADFKKNKNREVIKFNRLLFIDSGKTLPVKYSGTYYEIILPNEKILNISFWE